MRHTLDEIRLYRSMLEGCRSSTLDPLEETILDRDTLEIRKLGIASGQGSKSIKHSSEKAHLNMGMLQIGCHQPPSKACLRCGCRVPSTPSRAYLTCEGRAPPTPLRPTRDVEQPHPVWGSLEEWGLGTPELLESCLRCEGLDALDPHT